jgi:putative redox protein
MGDDQAKPPVRVTLTSIGPAAYEAVAERSGGALVLDGPPELGGEGRGIRPMELLLPSLAGCAAMDVGKILRQQREPLEGLRVEVSGVRADAVPAPFTEIHLIFVARGAVAPQKLERAVRLAVEKYCSVGASLAPEIVVRHEARLEP